MQGEEIYWQMKANRGGEPDNLYFNFFYFCHIVVFTHPMQQQ